MTLRIVPSVGVLPVGKLADVEVWFDQQEGVLDGLKLVGFAVWERRGKQARSVTFPARQFSVNGGRRTFALLRPAETATAGERLRQRILEAYAEHQEREVTTQ